MSGRGRSRGIPGPQAPNTQARTRAGRGRVQQTPLVPTPTPIESAWKTPESDPTHQPTSSQGTADSKGRGRPHMQPQQQSQQQQSEQHPQPSTSRGNGGNAAVKADRGSVRARTVITDIIRTKPENVQSKRGTSGIPVNLTTNHFRLIQTPNWQRKKVYRMKDKPLPKYTPIHKLSARRQPHNQQPITSFFRQSEPTPPTAPTIIVDSSESETEPVRNEEQRVRLSPTGRNGQYKRLRFPRDSSSDSTDSEPFATKRSKTTEKSQSDEPSNINKVPLAASAASSAFEAIRTQRSTEILTSENNYNHQQPITSFFRQSEPTPPTAPTIIVDSSESETEPVRNEEQRVRLSPTGRNGQYKRLRFPRDSSSDSTDSEPFATKRSKTTEKSQSDEPSNINKVPLAASAASSAFETVRTQRSTEILTSENNLAVKDLVTKHKITVDIAQSVENDGWLEDNVISAALEALLARYENVQFIPPELSITLKSMAVEEWSLELGEADVLLFPMSNARPGNSPFGSHWYLIVYNRLTHHSYYYDSLPQHGELSNDAVFDFCGKLNEFSVFERNIQQRHIHTFTNVKCTQQVNGYDCGIHVLLNAEAAIESLRTNSTFVPVTKEQVENKRRQLAQELKEAVNPSPPMHSRNKANPNHPPENVPSQPTKNVPHHSGVKIKSGRSQRRANYAMKRKESKKAVKDARFGRPAPKKLKAKRLNLGLVLKIYTKQVPGTPQGNTMPRSKSKPNSKPNKKFVKRVLKRQHKHKLGADEEHFTIVRTLNSFLADTPWKKDMRERFIDDSKVISKLAIEASFMINLHYVTLLQQSPNFEIEDEPKFRELFACLKSTGKGPTYKRKQEEMRPYFTLRNKYGHRLYPSENRTNTICMAADTYETCLANNIREHMYKRVRHFFRLMHPKIESYKTLDHLFNWQSTFEGDKVLIASLRTTLAFDGNFHELTSKWWTFIPFLYRLQQWHVANGTKSFRLFPILQRRHFVQYDGQAFQQFLRNWELSPCNYNEFEEDEAWRRYFKVDKIESSGHSFSNHIRTDGVSVSITMKRSNRPDADRATALAKARSKLERHEIENVRAYDPGHRLIFAGIDRNLTTMQETSIKYSSRSYHYACGRHRYQAEYNRIANPLLRKLQVIREALPNKASAVLDFMEFLNFELQHFNERNAVLMNEPLTKLRFRRYVSKQKATSELAKRLVGSRTVTTDTIVVCGSTEQSTIVKGYIRTPNKRIFDEIKRLAPLTFRIDEFRSTMLCSRCFNPATTSKSPHRWQRCNSCKINWNRDINASRNICYLGLNEIMGLATNRAFSRMFNFPGTAKDYQYESPKPHTTRDTIRQRVSMRADARNVK